MTHYLCDTCLDTHRMELDSRIVMCTHCPVPCKHCGDNGPYCLATPCTCVCHVGHWRYRDYRSRVAAPVVLPEKVELSGELVKQALDALTTGAHGIADMRVRDQLIDVAKSLQRALGQGVS